MTYLGIYPLFYVAQQGVFMSKTLDEFWEDLGQQESSGNYKAVNRLNYLGKYQMGEAAMVDAGYYKPKPDKNYNNKWDGEFTGKDGVFSVEDFLNNPQAQENAQYAYKKAQWRGIKNFAKQYNGKVINGIPITESGMLAGAHLVGQGALHQYLSSSGNYLPQDDNQVTVEKYLRKFAGYDVSEITNPQPEDPYLKSLVDTIMSKYIGDDKTFSREDIKNMTNEEFMHNEKRIFEQMTNGTLKDAKPDYQKYINPLTRRKKVFTKEEVNKMSYEEFSQFENEIMAQANSIGLPARHEVYKQSAYSAKGKWVTINGKHVLIDK